MRKQELTNMLRCIICEGLFRFAHTIVECGHTFCQVCLFRYIRGFKGRNPAIKCPQCHLPVQSNYKRSIIRDIFKQTLVDTIAPEYSKEDQIIVKRVQQLFPQFELEYIFEEFKFATFQMPMKMSKKESESNISARLPEKIKQKFNVSFQIFCEKILNEENFKSFLNVIKNGPPEPIVVPIRPKTERDFNYVGINSSMKAPSLNAFRLQRFIEKKALQRLNNIEKLPEEWSISADEKIEIRIYLQINGCEIDINANLESLLASNKGHPITYTLTKPTPNLQSVV